MRQAKVNSKKFIAIFTAFCMLLTFMPMSVSAAETEGTVTAANAPVFQDVTGHWGQTAIEKWSGYGIVNGYEGLFRPDDSITRGEMAVILDNLMDYQVAAENKFSDLQAGQFYTEAILKANAAGIIKGDGVTVRPLDKITREESAVMMSRAFAVAGSDKAMSFLDGSMVSDWAKSAVSGMEAKGYVSGYAGNFDPKANITRAAAVTMINNIVKAYYTEAGTYTENVEGTAVVKVTGVVLKGITITGNLIIAEGVAKGESTLDHVTVKGETVVRGGGENSIHIIGNSNLSSIRIEKVGDKLRIVVGEGADVKTVEVAAGEEIIITGTVGTLTVNASDVVVHATAAEINAATITGSNSTIVVGAQSTINSVVVFGTADNTAIKTEAGAVVKTVEASATVAVSGTGTVSTVTLKTGADGSSVTTPKTSVPVAEGVTGVTGTGGTAIPAGSTATNGNTATAPATVEESAPASGGGGGAGGGGTLPTDPGPASAPELTSIDVNPSTGSGTSSSDPFVIAASVDAASANVVVSIANIEDARTYTATLSIKNASNVERATASGSAPGLLINTLLDGKNLSLADLDFAFDKLSSETSNPPVANEGDLVAIFNQMVAGDVYTLTVTITPAGFPAKAAIETIYLKKI